MTDTATLRQHHREGFRQLDELWSEIDAIEARTEDLAKDAPAFLEDPVDRVVEKIRAFEPQVSVIGQVKAGKSTLLNALIGQTDMLPSDVNPWTSVITAMHLNARHRPLRTAALFRFFDAHEWDRLVSTGGRLGEMAARAGFEAEANAVRAQVTEMRETTEARLGDEFSRLLGSSRAFPEIDKDTIDRYICYGDPDDLADGATEGVYADITKSADLYLDGPDLPRGLCLRDTPGVNDTFMMREQITLNAIAESRVCVVVLSAHQALSTMDVALLRIICSVEAREVLIFVNRIDELPDPGAEIPRIRASIEATLGRTGTGEGIEILFGSGYWANCALSGQIGRMMPASRAALARFSPEARSDEDRAALTRAAMEASGVPALHRAIARRVVEGPGRTMLADLRSEIDAIVEMRDKVRSVAGDRRPSGVRPGLDAARLAELTASVREIALESFDAGAADLREGLRARLERARVTFANSAVDALQAHIDAAGETSRWSHDPSDLRMMMKSAFYSACTKLRRQGEIGFDIVLEGMEDILAGDLGLHPDLESIEFPEHPQHRAPTALGQTMSLDLQGPWWRKFWRFGSRRAAAKRYRALILDETAPLVETLLSDFFDEAAANTRKLVVTFADDQAAFLGALLDCLAGEGDPPAETITPSRRLSA